MQELSVVQIGNDCPDVASSDLKAMWEVTQKLVRTKQISAGHDISDGGLAVALLEMAFASNLGLQVAPFPTNSTPEKPEILDAPEMRAMKPHDSRVSFAHTEPLGNSFGSSTSFSHPLHSCPSSSCSSTIFDYQSVHSSLTSTFKQSSILLRYGNIFHYHVDESWMRFNHLLYSFWTCLVIVYKTSSLNSPSRTGRSPAQPVSLSPALN